MEVNKTYLGDCLEVMRWLPDGSIDAIVTDPPYGYLKHKLDCVIDILELTIEFKRLLKPDGFVVMFGRGVQFYKWNVLLSEYGFNFKEEIIWNKRMSSTIFNPISRVHETISIYSKGNGVINRCRIPYAEEIDIKSIKNDVQRINIGLNGSEREALLKYILNGVVEYTEKHINNHNLSAGNNLKNAKRSVKVTQKILEGFVEKSIIEISRDHYSSKQFHPTQKPVRLLERLINLVTKEGDLVLDPFAGSGTTGVACINTNRNYILIEKDKDYYDIIIKLTEQAKEKAGLYAKRAV